jgi:hypothetical protein
MLSSSFVVQDVHHRNVYHATSYRMITAGFVSARAYNHSFGNARSVLDNYEALQACGLTTSSFASLEAETKHNYPQHTPWHDCRFSINWLVPERQLSCSLSIVQTHESFNCAQKHLQGMNGPLHGAARAHHQRLAAAGLPNGDAHHAVVLSETQHNFDRYSAQLLYQQYLTLRLITAINHPSARRPNTFPQHLSNIRNVVEPIQSERRSPLSKPFLCTLYSQYLAYPRCSQWVLVPQHHRRTNPSACETQPNPRVQRKTMPQSLGPVCMGLTA